MGNNSKSVPHRVVDEMAQRIKQTSGGKVSSEQARKMAEESARRVDKQRDEK